MAIVRSKENMILIQTVNCAWYGDVLYIEHTSDYVHENGVRRMECVLLAFVNGV